MKHQSTPVEPKTRWETVDEWWERQPTPLTCHYCGAAPLDRKLTRKHPLRATVDHKIPMVKRGSSSLRKNGVVACFPCNQDKGALMPDEWMVVLKYRSERRACEA